MSIAVDKLIVIKTPVTKYKNGFCYGQGRQKLAEMSAVAAMNSELLEN